METRKIKKEISGNQYHAKIKAFNIMPKICYQYAKINFICFTQFTGKYVKIYSVSSFCFKEKRKGTLPVYLQMTFLSQGLQELSLAVGSQFKHRSRWLWSPP